ncbi:hypothetical protein [Blastococcus sp. PRF04-17]|uniref:hypothetical protein n=1 Tax=Blastococcus sp. PRF04-17 TaxID=2933797 RepID=UPI001FF34547|nr:hypothetical protein [Blastococcus sp. PRF04-17]UOY03200.1 hypothetical protein MVA48_07605 [Blastococcus sp. PRF04-17]
MVDVVLGVDQVLHLAERHDEPAHLHRPGRQLGRVDDDRTGRGDHEAALYAAAGLLRRFDAIGEIDTVTARALNALATATSR